MKKMLRLTYLGGTLWNLAFFLITPFILKLYSLSDEAVRLVMILVFLPNVFNALFCPVSFSVSNGMRAAGDVISRENYEKGIQFYRDLIDELLENGIEPIVTLYHYDLPWALVEKYGGWLDRQVVEDFLKLYDAAAAVPGKRKYLCRCMHKYLIFHGTLCRAQCYGE